MSGASKNAPVRKPRLRWRQYVCSLTILYTSTGHTPVRTNIEIDDELLSEAMAAAGLPTKRAAVEEGLRLLVRVRRQTKALENLKALGWEGNLDEMRQDRSPGRP
ncbi:type II toxin-antitoxin system VapB family antitoxin [Roseiarcus sp.]|uniref:type II toxin-antitoxin system VapB family antitoxin n=1 Tax=Roseiarcus sp. TaxID=1969460 RepID=UPI003C70F4FA